ncbi:uncharacterized protein HMPREF1541_11147 [Cyphellophora europaea CBS 101466]|uniref:Uncharacterized protein n=1 Tax=Cyphellophora europaea (strain CBS 101466) TaxID=1220924 RepID=W2S701_CYPE1|nr:uncharacterized protein HMPREF1541_11147 [Cyphellophora europaea CBS 101466]ETN43823.1 hypothetical protein HMPREF1541_11147 [Cyphellophora europaea CBS 101466]
MAASLLSSFGAATLLVLTLRFVCFLRPYARPSTLKRYLGNGEAWALVTGASDGIGLAFVQELAQRGFNVVIHGGNSEKLKWIKAQLEQQYPSRHFQTLLLDARLATTKQILKLKLPKLAVLVNNIGAGTSDQLWLRFLDRTAEEVADVVTINATFGAVLTRQLLPGLSRPGLIINVGSVVDSWPSAYLEPYCGTKGFVRSFSEALRTEMIVEGHDIEIMHLRVFSVATKSSHDAPSFVTSTPRAMAMAGLDRVGCGAASTAGLLRHGIIIWLIELMPRQMLGVSLSGQVKWKIGKG